MATNINERKINVKKKEKVERMNKCKNRHTKTITKIQVNERPGEATWRQI